MQLRSYNYSIINVIKAADYIEKGRSNKMSLRVEACKDGNKSFIDVVLQEARLLHLNINLFIEKKRKRKSTLRN